MNKIPKYKSHYSRQYLTLQMATELMCSLYKSETDNPVNLSQYKHILYTHINISRKRLEKKTPKNSTLIQIHKYWTAAVGKVEHERYLKAAEDAIWFGENLAYAQDYNKYNFL